MFTVKKPSIGLSFVNSPSRCQKHLAKQCDINNIIARLVRGDRSDIRNGVAADFTQISDNLHDNMIKIVEAKNAYDSLSPEVRKRFPSMEQFYSALYDEKMSPVLKELGIFKPDFVEEPLKVSVVEQPKDSNPSPTPNT